MFASSHSVYHFELFGTSWFICLSLEFSSFTKINFICYPGVLFATLLAKDLIACINTAELKFTIVESRSVFSISSIKSGSDLPHIVAWKTSTAARSFSFSGSNLYRD